MARKINQEPLYISAFWDWLPNLGEVAGGKIPNNVDGISMLPSMKGLKQKQHDYLYWEFPSYGVQQAVRMGNGKVFDKNVKS